MLSKVKNLFSQKKKPVSPQERREKSNKLIKERGIACYENLPMIESSADIKLKDLDTICRRAIASLLSTQVGCDIQATGDYKKPAQFFGKLLRRYGVQDCLIAKEQRLFNGEYSNQDVNDVVWEYESYWALMWALGLVDDISGAYSICDCDRAIAMVSDNKSYEEFKSKCQLRDVEEILDMLDLYFRYHWACVEKQIHPETEIGYLYPEVVWERRRGLEWLISDEEDWHEISLHT